MSEESTRAAFKRAFSAHTLLNLSPEEEASITVSPKSDEPTPPETPAEQRLKSKTHPSTQTRGQDSSSAC